MNIIEYSGAELKNILSKNKLNILYFYSKDNTPGCTTQAMEFTQLQNEFKKMGCEIIGVSKDNIESHKNFYYKHNLGVLLISDEKLELHKQYNIIGEKNLYGKKTIGVIRSTFLLDADANIIKEWRNIKAKGHANRVLEYLKSI